MKKSIKATIFFKVDKGHPDYAGIKEPGKEQSFTDTYIFNTDILGNVPISEMKTFCKQDLKLIAGGGYNSKHIHNVRFNFEEVKTI